MSGYYYSSTKTHVTYEVCVNVYDISESNSVLGSIGMGLYHTGVEINGHEYSFSNAGISKSLPRLPAFGRFKEQIKVGDISGGIAILNSTIASFRENEFAPGTYDLMAKNCNHFSNALCKALSGSEIPTWINRAASVGATVMPQSIREAATNATSLPSVPGQTVKRRSFFSFLFGQEQPREVIAGEVTIVSQKKELTEQQKRMLLKIKSTT